MLERDRAVVADVADVQVLLTRPVGPGPMAMSSQSVAPAPEIEYVPRLVPADVIAKTLAGSPESLCVHSTLAFIRLAAIPEASLMELFWTVPVEMPGAKLRAASDRLLPTVSERTATRSMPSNSAKLWHVRIILSLAQAATSLRQFRDCDDSRPNLVGSIAAAIISSIHAAGSGTAAASEMCLRPADSPK